MIRWLLQRLAPRFPVRVIYDREGGTPYLSRFYLFNGPRGVKWTKTGAPPEDAVFPGGPSLMLHRFHRSDDDGELHNHPWAWSVSLILAGGYSEERREPCAVKRLCGEHPRQPVQTGYRVVRRTVKPWRLNFIRGDDFHRVDLLETDCWTLFLAGPKTQSWGFWSRVTGLFTPWREFIAAKQEQTKTGASHG